MLKLKIGLDMPALIIISQDNGLIKLFDNNIKKTFTISQFDNLFSAYREMNFNIFKILLIDVDNMSISGGKDLLKSNGFDHQLDIIALTSDDSLENIRNLKENSVNKIILKPIDRNRFNRVIQNIYEQRIVV